MHLDVPEAVVETWMNRADSVMLASLIHLLENTLEDIREHDAAYLMPVGMEVVTITAITAKTLTSVERAIAAEHRHQLLYTTLGLVNKSHPADAARELLRCRSWSFVAVLRD